MAPPGPAMSVAQAVGEALAGEGESSEAGVRHVFGLLGSGNFSVTNALVGAGATFVAARHEGGAITMADAYARVSGRPGVCSVHQGPGLTNAMTGLTEAAKSRTPLLLLAADTSAAASQSNFRIEQDRLVNAVGALADRLYSPETAVADALRAYRRAQVERRPVVLMLPLDVQAAACPSPPPGAAGADFAAAEPDVNVGRAPVGGERARALAPSPRTLLPVRPSAAAVAEAARVLGGADRPLILAGRGAVLSGARGPLEALAERLGGLLATSAVANGLFAGNPWSLGISGGFASPAAAELIGEADVVLGVGVALNMWTTRHGRLLNPRATVIQVDRDAEAIGAYHRVDLAVIGDACETARELLEALGSGPRIGWRSDSTAARLRQGSWRAAPYVDASDEAHIDPRTLSLVLDDLLPAERSVAVDSGHFMGYPSMYLSVPDASAFVFTQAFQAVGLGLASAIGAAVARPDRLTVAALGDGGALMSLPEFETVARLGLRMLVVIYNDAAYGAEVHHFGPHGAPVDLVRFPDTDFAAVARGFGLEGLTVRSRTDLASLGAWLENGATPALVLDAKVVPTIVAEWLEEAFRGH
jgi:acetolactate synthase I/II/III large subunit